MQKIAINSGGEMDEMYRSAFIVTDENLDRIYGGLLPKNRLVVKAGERSKSLTNVEKIASAMLKRGVKRSDKVVAFGGGMVGDLLGFTASVYMRGIKWSFIPTSLLAMADSCIGGKTAVNIGFIKNAVGSFSLPDVFIETKYLHTLPKSEYESGMGEIVKMSLLDAELFDFMHGAFKEVDAIRHCVRVKSDIVKRDMYDKDVRKALNLGHTVGHAVEILSGMPHGKSVLVGMRLELLMLRDFIPHNFFYELQAYINGYLPNVSYNFDAEAVAVIASSDKKNEDGISVMYPVAIGDVREARLSKSEFLRLIKEAM